MAKPKKPLSAKDVRRWFDDANRKADLRSRQVLQVLGDAIKFGSAILEGSASELEVEAFFQRMHLVVTEVEDLHRSLAEKSDLGAEGGIWDCAKHAVVAHSALRNLLSDAQLVLIHYRRHASSHIAVDAYRLHVTADGISEERLITTLRRKLKVPEMDALLAEAMKDPKPQVAIARRSVTILKALLAISAPLYTPRTFKYDAHVVGDDDGTWSQLATKLGVPLEGLLSANDNPAPGERPRPASIVLFPTKR